MAEVRWTLQAADDLESITDFIAEDSPHYASLFAMDILAAVERLRAFPSSGRIVPEFNDPGLREFSLGVIASSIGSQPKPFRFSLYTMALGCWIHQEFDEAVNNRVRQQDHDPAWIGNT